MCAGIWQTLFFFLVVGGKSVFSLQTKTWHAAENEVETQHFIPLFIIKMAFYFLSCKYLFVYVGNQELLTVSTLA